jgi:alcohol dehydrogenase class IV
MAPFWNMHGITPRCEALQAPFPILWHCPPPLALALKWAALVWSAKMTHTKSASSFTPSYWAKPCFADPELTVGLPGKITAATGMDALTHNIESYLSPAYHPLCDGIALEGTRIGAAALHTAVHEPSNLKARSDMMMSSMMGAIAFQKDLGAVHSCAPRTGCSGRHAPWLGQRAHDRRGHGLELRKPCLKNSTNLRTFAMSKAAAVPLWLGSKELKASIGITGTLSSHGVKPEHMARLVQIATADICHQTNPRPCTSADFEKLFKAAM